MNKTGQLIKQAEQHCQSHGSRLTPKRKRVLTGLLQAEKALSAYELMDIYKAEFGEALPATSMYRILDFLQDEYLVHKLNLANKYVACAHIDCPHEEDTATQFLICTQCQKVEEVNISASTLKNLQHNAKAAGFHSVSPQLEMDGLCQHCMSLDEE